jgi:chromosome segregation ATPase
MTKPTESGTGSTKQTIEQLQARYQDLNKKKIQAETNLANALKQLEELKKEALEKYGTADVDELRKKLEMLTRENEEKRSKYQSDLDGIETEVAAVEKKFAASETPANGDA